MNNTYNQTILSNLPLPSFILYLKNSLLQSSIPQLHQLTQDIQNKQSPNHLLINYLTLFLIFFIIKTIWKSIFKPKVQVAKIISQIQIDEEIRVLGNYIRNMKNSLKRINGQINNNKDKQNQQKNNNQQSIHSNTSTNIIDVQQVYKLIKYYKQTAEQYQKLAQYILDSQQSIFLQLKKIKKLKGYTEKTSSNGSRDQNLLEIVQVPKQINTIKSYQEVTKVYEEKKQIITVFQEKKQQIVEEIVVKSQITVKTIPPPAPPKVMGAKTRRVPPPPIPK